MNYCLTMEQTRRIAVWFDADSDEEAEKKAREDLSQYSVKGL